MSKNYWQDQEPKDKGTQILVGLFFVVITLIIVWHLREFVF